MKPIDERLELEKHTNDYLSKNILLLTEENDKLDRHIARLILCIFCLLGLVAILVMMLEDLT